MPKSSKSETIPGSAHAVFEVVHDYGRRLEWDTLLQKAYIEDGSKKADVGVVTLCKAKGFLGRIEMRTRYVSFKPGKVAAVTLVNRPPFFESFAASIRHFEGDENHSEIVYEYNFKARPAVLRPLLHPVMKLLLDWETMKRLRALRAFFEGGC